MEEKFLIDLTDTIIKYVEILHEDNAYKIITKDLKVRHKNLSEEEIERRVRSILEKK